MHLVDLNRHPKRISTSTMDASYEPGVNNANNIEHYEGKNVVPVRSESVINDAAHILELDSSILGQMRQGFYGEPKNILAQNACTRFDPMEVAINRGRLESINHFFTHKVELEGKPVSNQKSSGRCWSFASLNTIRGPFMKAFNLAEFEFSHSFVFFYDKLERCNNFLHNIIKTGKEAVDSRVVSFLLSDPIPDGGQWQMLSDLITKYGLIPKKCFPESFCSETSARLNAILKSKLREFAKVLRTSIAEGADKSELQKILKQQMAIIFRILGICLGVPPLTFTWEYYQTKNNSYGSIGPITPKEFYEQHVRPVFDMQEKICLVTDARKSNEYNQIFTVDMLSNMVGGKPPLYNNQPITVLEQVAAESIKQGEMVWYGMEVGKFFAGKLGIHDTALYDYDSIFGVKVSLSMTREERLLYHDSCMSHAMVLTAVSLDTDGKPVKWRAQNSWGEDRGEKGFIVVSEEWFKEYVFEIVVDRKFVPPEILAIYDKEPIVLPPWDPMGILARSV